MLDITVPATERFDEKTLTFIQSKEQKLVLEHSLISLSKWESKWEKPFLSSEKTIEETIDYIKCMTLTQNVPDSVYMNLSDENIEAVKRYIESSMTATTIANKKKEGQGSSREIITAEIIYYWMVTLNIPSEYQKWHLNRLLKLIEVCSIKSQPPKKMPKNEVFDLHRKLNAMRRKKPSKKG